MFVRELSVLKIGDRDRVHTVVPKIFATFQNVGMSFNYCIYENIKTKFVRLWGKKKIYDVQNED